MSTCIACRLQFEDFEKQRDHYRSALHCFNLQRKVSGLPPLTQEVFDEKVSEVRREQDAELEGGAAKNKKKKRGAKKKTAARKINLPVLEGDLQRERSKQASEQKGKEKEKEKEKAMEAEDATSEVDEEAMIAERLRTARPVPPTECLFDGSQTFPTPAKCRKFMRQNYGLFVPDGGHLVDEDGLYEYLAEKVGIGFTCLWCDRSFSSLESVRRHMRDRQHTRMRFEGHEEEYTEFYDFEVIELSDDDDDDDEVEHMSASLYAELRQRAGARETENTLVVYEDAPATGVSVADNGLELVLPNGNVIGHRALRYHYRQKGHRRVLPEEPYAMRTVGGKEVALPRHRFWNAPGPRAVSDEQKSNKREQKRRRRLILKTQLKNNKTMNHHFRKQMMV